MTHPATDTQVDCLRIIATSFESTPDSLVSIIATIAQEDRHDLLTSAHAAGFLSIGPRQSLGLAVLPMLESEQHESVAAALSWIRDAGCDNVEMLTRALMTARSHFKELISLGADPNLIPSKAEQSPLGARVADDDLAGFAQMIDSAPHKLPIVSRTKNLFDVAIEEMTPARAEMVDYVLDRAPDTSLEFQNALGIAVVRLAVRRRHGPTTVEYPRAAFPTILRMIQRAGVLTKYHATAWHALFNSDFFAIERTSLETMPGERSEPKFLHNVLDLAHPDQAVELLSKAACEGFSINHPCIQVNGRSLPPLHYAALRGHQELVERLLTAGADPSAPDSRGASAVLVATIAGQAEIAATFARHG